MPGIFESFPYQLVLASSSPRRLEYLKHLGIKFRVEVPGIDEKQRAGETPAAYVKRNSLEKALAILNKPEVSPATLVIAADTIGVIDGRVLEKPLDPADAKRMLRELSGRSHEVLSGFTVAAKPRGTLTSRSQLVSTKVDFKPLSDFEIDYYVGTGEPLDKAGAYGIQGGAGFMVAKIEGSYSNVVGLPMAELVTMLGDFIRLA